jgi:hypothetical protein
MKYYDFVVWNLKITSKDKIQKDSYSQNKREREREREIIWYQPNFLRYYVMKFH